MAQSQLKFVGPFDKRGDLVNSCYASSVSALLANSGRVITQSSPAATRLNHADRQGQVEVLRYYVRFQENDWHHPEIR